LSKINQSKEGFVVGHVLLSMFDHYNDIPLTVNISFQKLDIHLDHYLNLSILFMM